jgi:hypothetical protein
VARKGATATIQATKVIRTTNLPGKLGIRHIPTADFPGSCLFAGCYGIFLPGASYEQVGIPGAAGLLYGYLIKQPAVWENGTEP